MSVEQEEEWAVREELVLLVFCMSFAVGFITFLLLGGYEWLKLLLS